jgi:hypothetical protein
MATVRYTIVSGAAPFTAELTPSLIPDNVHVLPGTYQFINVPNGGYTLVVTDSNGCEFRQIINVDPLVTTTTTTQAPGNSIVVGNTQDEGQIFNVNATNTDAHYEGYPDPNTVTLYLWLKTLNGVPLTAQRVVNYTIAASGASIFVFSALSDEIHAEVIQGTSGPSAVITGQLILKTGFIETFFKYTYVKNPSDPNFRIDLNSTGDWLYTSIPLTSGLNVYGVTYIDRDNVIMNF